MPAKKFISVKIPKMLAEELKEKMAETEFKKLDDYVTHLLRELLEEME